MPTINASKYGYMISSASGTGAFATVRGASTATGTVINQSTSNNQYTVGANVAFSSKGDTATLRRTWWAFNVSSYASGYTISNLNLKFDPTTNTSTNFPIAVIKSTAQGNANTNLSQSDWDSLDFNTLYSDNSSTNYWPDSNSVSTIGLNSTAISAFSTGYLKVCIVWWFDYTGVGSLVTFNGQAVINYGYTPRIEFTAVASGYANTVINVADHSGINNVSTTDISAVINVGGEP